MSKKKKINLALQGGGAHGAFTWGLLDAFLESDLFIIDGISATSAGSMNAAALAHGYLEGGNEGARAALHHFWHAMSESGKKFGITAKTPFDPFVEPFLHAPLIFSMFSNMTNTLSPYQFNPSNYHPIKEVLDNVIDMERLRTNHEIKLFICASNVKTGKIRIFENHELSTEVFLASACLPKLFQAVEVDGEHYWDGGYLGDPAIFPLIYDTSCRDIIIFHTVPIIRQELPTTVAEIDSRLREISFNSSLMREMRAIAFVSGLIQKGWIKKEFEDQMKKVFMHGIRADESLCKLPLPSVYTPDWDFLTTLRDLGRKDAKRWIAENFSSIGKKTTINFDEWL